MNSEEPPQSVSGDGLSPAVRRPREVMTYAGFWPRFGALWLDFLVLTPVFALSWWGGEHFRLFSLYYLLPGTVLGAFYGVYLVKRFGGTPGKRLMKLRIVMVGGKPITYRAAILRYLPEWLIGLVSTVGLVVAVLHLTDAQYFGESSFLERSNLVERTAPAWHRPLTLVQTVWVYGELVVILTNRKRRAIHDFIAGTVVIRDPPPGEVVDTRRSASPAQWPRRVGPSAAGD